MTSARLLAGALLAIVLPACAAAQGQTTCTAEQLPNSRHTAIKLPSAQYNDFWGGGISVRCPSRRIVLKADSAEIYGDERRMYLVGHVDYREPRFTLNSDFLTYFMAEERIVAAGNVHGKMPSGSTLVGPQAQYLRAVPRVRTRAQLTAIGRPTVTLVERDEKGKAQPPVTVISNTIFMDGDSLLYGSGQVEITRPELKAHGDSVFLDTGRETMRLMRQPSIDGTKDRPFRLVGTLIDMYSRNRKLQRVISREHAVATSQDLTLKSDTIDLRVNNDLLQDAMAWGVSRAHATSPTQDILADSIHVIMPAQRVREVRSYRKAFAQGKPDTTKFHIDKGDPDSTDWMRGDTIIAHFDTAPPPPPKTPKDTAKGPTIKQLESRGDASSLYHLPPQDSCARKPAISYVRGHIITVDFDKQQVSLVTVDGQPTKGANAAAAGAGGVYLEPKADTTSACYKKQNEKPAPNAKAGQAPATPKTPAQRPPAGTPTPIAKPKP